MDSGRVACAQAEGPSLTPSAPSNGGFLRNDQPFSHTVLHSKDWGADSKMGLQGLAPKARDSRGRGRGLGICMFSRHPW